ncbi:MAG: hypothetical protein WC283_00960 [Candidatus Paceibacterota bacterium]|jgi:F0F1-type ATP synthase assembly protein I
MKLLKNLGLFLFFLGLSMVLGFGLYKFFGDSSVPLIIRWGIIGFILGTVIIIISLIIERFRDIKNNK